MPQSSDIEQNSDEGITGFPISSQSLIKVNCHNSRTLDDIGKKLGPVSKITKRNKATSKDNNDVMMAKCDVIVIFPIYDQSGEIQKPYSGRIVCKTYFSLTVTIYLAKQENKTKKSLTQLSHYCF